MNRRLAAISAVLISTVGLAACGATASTNKNSKPSKDAQRFLVAGPSKECSTDATPAQSKDFIRKAAVLTDEQLASVCPQLYPAGFLSTTEIAKLRKGNAIEKSDSKGATRKGAAKN